MPQRRRNALDRRKYCISQIILALAFISNFCYFSIDRPVALNGRILSMNKTARILVVNNKPKTLRVYEKTLNAAGYEVLKASTGRRGLQLAREGHPELVLLNILLPDPNGVEVCKQIKGDAGRDIFVILISDDATTPFTRARAWDAVRMFIRCNL